MQNCIVMEYSPPYGSQSNGAAERLIQELWKIAITLLHSTELSILLWGEAISHANWLQTWLPSSRINMEIPYTRWFGPTPDSSTLLKFGTKGQAFINRSENVADNKLLPRTLHRFFVGMEGDSTLYRICILKKEAIVIFRTPDFKVLQSDDTLLPSISSLMH